MIKKWRMLPIILFIVALLPACGGDQENDMASDSLPVEIILESKYDDNDQQSSQQETYNTVSFDTSGPFSEEQALTAVRKYYETLNPGYDNDEDLGDYWDVSRNDNGEIVVIYRSYTGSINRYYVDEATGNTYVTEQVPGIIDDEQMTSESFNIKYYLENR